MSAADEVPPHEHVYGEPEYRKESGSFVRWCTTKGCESFERRVADNEAES